MPGQKNNSYMAGEWFRLEEELRDEGVSRTKAWEVISELYDTTYHTVRYWLDEGQRNRHRDRYRPGRYHREPRRKEYNIAYKRFTRNLPDFIDEVLEVGEAINLEKLVKKLAKAAKNHPKVSREIEMKPETLKRRIEEVNDDLLYQVKPGRFEYRDYRK